MQAALALLALLALTAVSRINSAQRGAAGGPGSGGPLRSGLPAPRAVTAPAQVRFFEVYSRTWFAASYLLLVSTTGCVLCLAIRNIQERAKEADTPKASTAKPTRCSSKEALAP